MANLSGTWLGSYWQKGKQIRFEMSLIQSGNTLIGSISDDGRLGDAHLTGEVIGRTIRFSKKYILLKQSPVNYQGTLSDDGNLMSGKWDFFGTLGFQSWEAYRKGENLVLVQMKTQQKTLQSSMR